MTSSRDWESERAIVQSSAGGREALIVESFARLTGNQLAASAQALWSLPAAVVAHGTEEDPIFFYGNRAALELFEIDAADFIALPSRFSAEPLDREERARLMERVTRENFIDDYSGVRVTATGKRFRIERATVWNLIDADGVLQGQAATFDQWTFLGEFASGD